MPDEPVIVTPAPLSGLVQAALSTCVAAVALGVIYGYLFARVPFAYIVTPVGTVVFGYLIARVAEQGFIAGHVRSRRAILWVPLGAGLLGYYVGWIAWLATVHATRDAFGLVWRPMDLILNLKFMSHTGTWELLGWQPKIFDLWSLWAVELIVFVASVHASADAVAKRLAAPGRQASTSRTSG